MDIMLEKVCNWAFSSMGVSVAVFSEQGLQAFVHQKNCIKLLDPNNRSLCSGTWH